MEFQKKNFVPVFRSSFLKPKYWGTWLIIGIIASMAMLSPKIRDPILRKLATLCSRLTKKARYRASINLYYCVPELSELQRKKIIDRMFATALQAIVMLVELNIYSLNRIRQRVDWYGREIIDMLQRTGENIIFLVPHSWSMDIPAMLLASEGKMIAAMFHNQKDSLMDYLWNTMRLRFGGRIHARNNGIKHFIKSVRQGYYGYYLPDQDHGSKNSEFVDFFATYKATLPVLGKLKKLCNATLVPMFAVYNSTTHRLEIYVHPPMKNLMGVDKKTLARRMNEEVESFVRPHLEQYTWILKLLKTRKEGDINPYIRRDILKKTK